MTTHFLQDQEGGKNGHFPLLLNTASKGLTEGVPGQEKEMDIGVGKEKLTPPLSADITCKAQESTQIKLNQYKSGTWQGVQSPPRTEL